MLLGSTLAGMAMNPTRLGLAHALAMPLGSWDLKIPHSVAIAVTLAPVMRFNCCAATKRFADVARALGYPEGNENERIAAEQAPAIVRTLANAIGIPKRLSGYGLREHHVTGCGRGSDEERQCHGQSARDDEGSARDDSEEHPVGAGQSVPHPICRLCSTRTSSRGMGPRVGARSLLDSQSREAA